MLWVPQKGSFVRLHNTGTVGSITCGTSVTTGAAASTKGTPAELISAANNTIDTYWITVVAYAYGNTATDSQGALDILVGAATEEVLIPNLLMGFCGTQALGMGRGHKTWQFPLYIPAGTRIAAQAAGQRVSTALRVCVYLYGDNGLPPFRVGRKVTTYGMGTVPFGTTIVPGASGAEGSWTSITASTSEDHFAFVPSFQPGTDTTLNTLHYALDLGVAANGEAASTAVEISQSYWFPVNSDEAMLGAIPPMPTFCDVPATSVLAMRVSNSGANDVGNYNAVIHAVS